MLFAQVPEIGLDSNLLRNLLQMGSFGVLVFGIFMGMWKGIPMLKAALEDIASKWSTAVDKQTMEHKQIVTIVSTDYKATFEKISTDHKMAMEKMSDNHKAAMDKMSVENKAALERVSSESKAAIEKLIIESREQMNAKNAECAREREEYRRMIEQERLMAAKEREEYRKADKDLREILQSTVSKIEIVTGRARRPG